MRTVDVVTTSRADFGIYVPILRELSARPGVACRLIVSGSHLDERYGATVSEIESAGFPIEARVPVFNGGEEPVETARTIANGVRGFAECFASLAPDLIVVLGDRFEMFSAAIAALPLKVPVAHLHGGEVTAGSFDDAIRHAMTKLSHLHFTSTEAYAARVRQLGEEPWRITVSGAPGLDNLAGFEPVPEAELKKDIGLRASGKPLLITFHPTTLDPAPPREQVANLLSALDCLEMPLIFTAPNADPGRSEILAMIDAFVARHSANAVILASLGNRLYFSAMAHAAAMAGNSSSGIIEAAAFRLPVLDIGSRQEGRLKPDNVLTVSNTRDDVRLGLRRILDPAFRAGLGELRNPYFAGGAARIIADRLTSVPLDERLLMKHFADVAM